MSLAMHEPRADLMAYALNAAWLYGRSSLSPLREAGGAMADILKAAQCPSCDGRGWYAVPSMPDGEPVQQQCQWCDQRPIILARWSDALSIGEDSGDDEADAKLVYEDELAKMTKEEYDAWYRKSEVIDGVRMGPQAPHNSGSWISVEAAADAAYVYYDGLLDRRSGRWQGLYAALSKLLPPPKQ